MARTAQLRGRIKKKNHHTSTAERTELQQEVGQDYSLSRPMSSDILCSTKLPDKGSITSPKQPKHAVNWRASVQICEPM